LACPRGSWDFLGIREFRESGKSQDLTIFSGSEEFSGSGDILGSARWLAGWLPDGWLAGELAGWLAGWLAAGLRI